MMSPIEVQIDQAIANFSRQLELVSCRVGWKAATFRGGKTPFRRVHDKREDVDEVRDLFHVLKCKGCEGRFTSLVNNKLVSGNLLSPEHKEQWEVSDRWNCAFRFHLRNERKKTKKEVCAHSTPPRERASS